MTGREKLIQHISKSILALPHHEILRVGIDGDAGSGKSTFGDELRDALLSSKRPIIRGSVDSFHNPREIRYRRGKMSPDGFFMDSYNYDLLAAHLLDPLSPNGSRRYRRGAFDHRTDSPLLEPEQIAASNAILIFDGIFLHRGELVHYWDYSVFLDVSVETGLMRCAMRGDGSPDPHAASNFRYVEGQRKYLSECRPVELATIVIDNDDLEKPKIKKSGTA